MSSAAFPDVTIEDVDVSVVAGLDMPGAAWERVKSIHFRIFEGIETPLMAIRETGGSYYIDGTTLTQWERPFPYAGVLAFSVRLKNGSVLGGKSRAHLHYIKRPGSDEFVPLADAKDIYWTSYVEGSDTVFGRFSKDGPLMILQDEVFRFSPFPGKGVNKHGEFLPWYSTTIKGYFKTTVFGVWFLADGEQDWQEIDPSEPRSLKPGLGLNTRGSTEHPSPNGALLKVISESRTTLNGFYLADGRPKIWLPNYVGTWHPVAPNGSIFGWLGSWHRIFVPVKIGPKLKMTPQNSPLSHPIRTHQHSSKATRPVFWFTTNVAFLTSMNLKRCPGPSGFTFCIVTGSPIMRMAR